MSEEQDIARMSEIAGYKLIGNLVKERPATLKGALLFVLSKNSFSSSELLEIFPVSSRTMYLALDKLRKDKFVNDPYPNGHKKMYSITKNGEKEAKSYLEVSLVGLNLLKDKDKRKKLLSGKTLSRRERIEVADELLDPKKVIPNSYKKRIQEKTGRKTRRMKKKVKNTMQHNNKEVNIQ